MIDYKLAKQLKEAGFPQKGAGKTVAGPMNGNPEIPEYIYVPILEELIEACGEGFERLIRIKAGTGGVVFQAQGGYENYEVAQYKTPTEAVARLWLALNPKK